MPRWQNPVMRSSRTAANSVDKLRDIKIPIENECPQGLLGSNPGLGVQNFRLIKRL